MTSFIFWFLPSYLLAAFAFSHSTEPSATSFPDFFPPISDTDCPCPACCLLSGTKVVGFTAQHICTSSYTH